MVEAGVLILAGLVVLVTILSAVPSHYWWIRIWDFPRELVCAFGVLAGALVAILSIGPQRWIALGALALALAWQLWRMWPYTRLVRTEVEMVDTSDPRRAGHCFKALSFNVLQTNRDYARTIKMIDAHDPDIVLLLETDKKWETALADVIARYPTYVGAPLDNLYGLIFLTRLEIAEPRIEYMVEDDIPSIFAKLKTRAGKPFRYMGLHPRPPEVGNDTDMRDAEIAIAARRAAEDHLPVLAMGDFNDVAWSRTSQLFKRIGEYLDPRIGRGQFATFPAVLPLFKWPLDHLFFTREFTIGKMDVLPGVGSDHLPVLATICLLPEEGEAINEAPETADASDQAEADEMIELAEENGADIKA